jgi:hypothetical protein
MIQDRVRLGCIAAVLLCSPLSAADLPEIKVGLWSVDSREDKVAMPQSLVCMNSAVVQELMKEDTRMLPAGKCASTIAKDGSSYVESTDCTLHRGDVHVKSVLTLHGNKTFHIDATRTGHAIVTTLIDGKYISACPAAMQVGDVVAPNGAKINVMRDTGVGAPQPDSGSSSGR